MTTAIVSASVTINAAISAAFNCLSDLSCHYKWNPHLERITPTMVLHKGAIYQASSKVLGHTVRAVNVVTEFQRPRKLVIENSSGALRYRVQYQLHERRLPDGRRLTELSCETRVVSDSHVFHLAAPLVEAVARDKLKADLEAFKSVVEGESGTPVTELQPGTH